MLNLEPPALTGAVSVCSTSNEASGGGSIVLYRQARVQLAIARVRANYVYENYEAPMHSVLK